MEPSEVLLIGIDGGTFKILQPGIASGQFPTFKKLILEGASGVLTSTIPPATSPAFPTLMTGKNPGKHGVFSFITVGETKRHCNAVDIAGKTLWQILSDHGKKSLVVNIPLTWPPEKIDGVMVTGMMTPPGSDYTYPPELAKMLDEVAQGYPVTFNPKFWEASPKKFLKEIHNLIDKQYKALSYLMDNYEWSLLAYLFRATDIASHNLWGNAHQDVMGVYEHVDSVIGEITKKTPNAHVFIFSDHGFGDYFKNFNLNLYLKAIGLLVEQRTLPISKTPRKKAGKSSANPVSTVLAKLGLYRSHFRAVLPRRLLVLMRRIFSQRFRKFFPISHLEVDKHRSKAYYERVLLENPSITLNASNKQEYEALVKRLKTELSALRDPDTGESVISEIYHRNEVVHGPYVERAPDIIILLNEGYKASTTLVGSQIIEETGKTMGAHDINGIFIAKGPFIRRSYKVNGIHIRDLAPTILHLLGLPIPEDLDGKMKGEIFIPNSPPAKRAPEFYVPVVEEREAPRQLTAEEKDEITSRLKKLGYID